MGIDYDAVLRKKEIRTILGPEKIAEAMEDEDFLPNLIIEEGQSFLTLRWDGTIPGGSGANYLSEWNKLYFFTSTDWDEEGPFDSLEEAVELEYFHFKTFRPELSSDILPLERLLEIGRDLIADEGDMVSINNRLFVLSDGQLVESPSDAAEGKAG